MNFRRICLVSFCLIFICLPAFAAGTYTVQAQRNKVFTVKVPCEYKAVFNPEEAQVEGSGQIAAVMPYSSTIISFVCRHGKKAYTVIFDVTDVESPASFEIVDDEEIKRTKMQKVQPSFSYETKEEILKEARYLLSSIVQGKVPEGYEFYKENKSISSTDRDISVVLDELFSGELIGQKFILRASTLTPIVRHIKDFSGKGIVLLYSPQMSPDGTIVFKKDHPVVLYAVTVPVSEEYDYSRIPWIDKTSKESKTLTIPLPPEYPGSLSRVQPNLYYPPVQNFQTSLPKPGSAEQSKELIIEKCDGNTCVEEVR